MNEGGRTPALRGKDLLELESLEPGEIQLILETARPMLSVFSRPVKKYPTLRGRIMVNLFYEPSTRTRTSFELAAKSLSADVVNIATTTSSVTKGESLADTARTLEALGADWIVLRHSASGTPAFLARQVRAGVINAGDGSHEHPTQGLLDLFTILRRKGRIAGLRVGLVGDILHSRVARSDLWGLTKMGAEVVLIGPPTLIPVEVENLVQTGSPAATAASPVPPSATGSAWPSPPLAPAPPPASASASMSAAAAAAGVSLPHPPVTVSYDLESVLPTLDVVQVLRLQLERQKRGLFPSAQEYSELYRLDSERLQRWGAKPDLLVMHPGPANLGLEISEELANSPRSAIREQVQNGVAVRMAVLYLLAGGRPAQDTETQTG
ncbi:MAG: aspartate carbamoyltransferase catalytic subunit [Limnochordaceae bacterium]|nr:aspartate carbamoyltransferase catalytic subunit [Limnochordaceae bacterium]